MNESRYPTLNLSYEENYTDDASSPPTIPPLNRLNPCYCACHPVAIAKNILMILQLFHMIGTRKNTGPSPFHLHQFKTLVQVDCSLSWNLTASAAGLKAMGLTGDKPIALASLSENPWSTAANTDTENNLLALYNGMRSYTAYIVAP